MNDYKKRIGEPMSGEEIQNYLPNSVLTTYTELSKYNDIDHLFGNYDIIILLYQMTSEFSGHWVVLLRNNETKHIHFFDSYGMRIDKELNYISNNVKLLINGNNRILSKMLRASNYVVTYNNKQYQKNGSKYQTCGRHCILRAINKDIDEDFYNNFYFEGKKLSPDDIVSILII